MSELVNEYMSEIIDFRRMRVKSFRHNLSVTAEVTYESFRMLDPDWAASKASCDLFQLTYLGMQLGGLPTFSLTVKNDPRDPELALRTLKARLEMVYDEAGGEQLVR